MENTEMTKNIKVCCVEWVEFKTYRHFTANREFEPFIQKLIKRKQKQNL